MLNGLDISFGQFCIFVKQLDAKSQLICLVASGSVAPLEIRPAEVMIKGPLLIRHSGTFAPLRFENVGYRFASLRHLRR